MHSLRLSSEQIDAITQHVGRVAPNEGCGLLVGTGNTVERVLSMENTADDPEHHYEMDGMALLHAHKMIDSADLRWLGVYHSHVTTDAIPSLDDIRDATLNTPNQVHVIVSLKHKKAKLQAWRIQNQQVEPVTLVIGRQRADAVDEMTRSEAFAVMLAVVIGVVLLLVIALTLLPPAPDISAM